MIMRFTYSLLIAAFLAFAAGGAAAGDGAVRIAVIDIQAVMQHSAAAQDAEAQYEALRAADDARIGDDMAAVTASYEALLTEASEFSDEDYQRRLVELREETEQHQRRALERRDALDAALRAALEEISATVERIADDYIRRNEFTAVQPRSTFIGTPALPDITDDVIARLDETLPEVALRRPDG